VFRTCFVAVAVATVCATGADAQSLRQGSRGDAVKRAQRALILHGHRVALDGIYGPKTAGAVKAFQRSRGLPATGRVDGATLRSLERPVQRGDRGAAVRQLQRQLNNNGAGLGVDGVFGPKTERALRAFQRSSGVSQTGRLDGRTLGKLLDAPGSSTGIHRAGNGGALRQSLIQQAKHYLSRNPGGFRSDVLVVVDFTKHSRNKRFFIVDLKSNRIEAWKTAHGSGSDPGNTGVPQRFSNRHGSKMSSIGFYRTAETYYGKYGYSLRIDGLSGTNSQARARAVVIHPSKYVREGGGVGRSWGCMSLDSRYSKHIIDRIKGGALIYAYGGQK